MGSLGVSTYRFRGVFDYELLYQEGRKFFLNIVDPPDFNEKKYKDKGHHFEAKWDAKQRVDAYHRIIYKVEYKAIDMKKVQKNGKTLYEGKIRFYVEPILDENYEMSGPGGKTQVFKENSIFHKLYKRITRREREEDLEGVAIRTGQAFIDKMKEICGAQARL
ncbi:hypothetical protein GOV11_02085 [Candidatus Woesearchaeota archaeon]|nr:hypothetical protein [Candidatus Woesearchaeota archaeon]